MIVKKSERFDSPSTVQPSGIHFPGGNRRKIKMRIEWNSILIYFTLYIIQNRSWRQLMGKVNGQRGVPAEMSADEPIVYVRISRIIQIRDI